MSKHIQPEQDCVLKDSVSKWQQNAASISKHQLFVTTLPYIAYAPLSPPYSTPVPPAGHGGSGVHPEDNNLKYLIERRQLICVIFLHGTMARHDSDDTLSVFVWTFEDIKQRQTFELAISETYI